MALFNQFHLTYIHILKQNICWENTFSMCWKYPIKCLKIIFCKNLKISLTYIIETPEGNGLTCDLVQESDVIVSSVVDISSVVRQYHFLRHNAWELSSTWLCLPITVDDHWSFLTITHATTHATPISISPWLELKLNIARLHNCPPGARPPSVWPLEAAIRCPHPRQTQSSGTPLPGSTTNK